MLNKLSAEYENQGVKFIGVSVDGPRNQAKVKPFVSSLGLSYPIVRDMDSELMSELGVTALPTLLIYRKDGELLHTHEGFRPGDEELIRKHIEAYLTQ